MMTTLNTVHKLMQELSKSTQAQCTDVHFANTSTGSALHTTTGYYWLYLGKSLSDFLLRYAATNGPLRPDRETHTQRTGCSSARI